jgi:hypothetical protein
MTAPRSFLALLSGLAAVAAILPAPAAWAAPSDTLTYHLTACSGPPGTPVNIDGVKQPHEGAALRLTSMSGNFIFMEASDATTGEVFSSTPGFQHNKLELVTCALDNPRDPGEQDIVKGLLSPAKA